ncbi:hypothetical protein NC651_035345 [Populus alba x Populus x berolinensis]|nr:hypothetical protein NC651_035345 [Populus alba x Populus x berolinensis]
MLMVLEAGEIYYKNKTPRMSRRNGSLPKLDLKLNLSPPRVNPRVESPGRSATVSPTSPPSSCVSSEMNQDDTLRYSSSPEATSMVLVGCPRCLMYVMLSENDPKCPKCKNQSMDHGGTEWCLCFFCFKQKSINELTAAAAQIFLSNA